MSILAKYNAAMEAKDEAAMNEIIHDDYKFTMHASGNVLGKADIDIAPIIVHTAVIGIHLNNPPNSEALQVPTL